MGKRIPQEKWERLERLVMQWNACSGDDDAARMTLNFDITEALLDVIPEQDIEAFGKVWEEIPEFDPEKGTFAAFVKARMKLRKIDQWRKDNDEGKVVLSPEEASATGKKEEYRRRWDALDAPVGGEDSDVTPGDLQEAPGFITAEEQMQFDKTMQELISLILLLPERLTGKANNPQRINYFRLFFTDGFVAAIFKFGAEAFVQHERDIFAAMKLSFLDFFLCDRCRSVGAILASDIKPYGEMVAGRAMVSISQSKSYPPLPNDVYVSYLQAAEGAAPVVSAISNNRKLYKEFIKESRKAFIKESLC